MKKEKVLVIIAVIAFVFMSGEAETLPMQIVWTSGWFIVLSYCVKQLGRIENERGIGKANR